MTHRKPNYIVRLPSEEGHPTYIWSRRRRKWLDKDHLTAERRIHLCAYPTFAGASQARYGLRQRGHVKGHVRFEVGRVYPQDLYENQGVDGESTQP